MPPFVSLGSKYRCSCALTLCPSQCECVTATRAVARVSHLLCCWLAVGFCGFKFCAARWSCVHHAATAWLLLVQLPGWATCSAAGWRLVVVVLRCSLLVCVDLVSITLRVRYCYSCSCQGEPLALPLGRCWFVVGSLLGTCLQYCLIFFYSIYQQGTDFPQFKHCCCGERLNLFIIYL